MTQCHRHGDFSHLPEEKSGSQGSEVTCVRSQQSVVKSWSQDLPGLKAYPLESTRVLMETLLMEYGDQSMKDMDSSYLELVRPHLEFCAILHLVK